MPASPSYAGPSSTRDDLYDDGPPPAADKAPDEQRENEDGQGAIVVPKEALGSKDVKVGDVCEFRADRILEKEVVFKYVPHGGDKDENEEPPPEPPPSESADESSMYD